MLTCIEKQKNLGDLWGTNVKNNLAYSCRPIVCRQISLLPKFSATTIKGCLCRCAEIKLRFHDFEVLTKGTLRSFHKHTYEKHILAINDELETFVPFAVTTKRSQV